MNCNTCGSQLPQGAANCPRCGAVTPYSYASRGTTAYGATSTAPAGSPPYVSEFQNPYNVSPYSNLPLTPTPPVPPPVRPSGNRVGVVVVILLAGLALLIIAGGIGLFAIIHANQAATFNANATATAHAQATATAIVALQNPYTHSGKLVLSDPLSDNSKGVVWAQDPINCGFIGGAYHVKAPDPKYYDDCMADASDYSNFVFEAQMQIIKGDGGGLIFRDTDTYQALRNYTIDVNVDGSYGLYLSNGSSSPTLSSGNDPAIKQRLNQSNLIAVIAQGNTIKVYVNHQQIASITDSTFSHGRIGFEANPFANNGHATEVVFSNAKVWTL